MDHKELVQFGIAVLRAIGCDDETAKEVALLPSNILVFMSDYWATEVSNGDVCLLVYLLFVYKDKGVHVSVGLFIFCWCLLFYLLFVCKDKIVKVSEHLVESNLQSVDSHGVIRLTQYTEQVFPPTWQELVVYRFYQLGKSWYK